MTLKKMCCLPVVVIITEETASGHINILLFLGLLLLLLLLLLLSGSTSNSSLYKSTVCQPNPTSNGGSSSATGLHQELSNVLLTKVLGEEHGPVGLDSDVGGLEDLQIK